MAGSTTAERGERQQESSGPPLLRRWRNRRFRRIVIPALAFVLLGSASVWLLYDSPWLRVRHVSVSGTAVLTPEQVLEVADVPVGASLVSVDTDGIEARLRRKLPRIDVVDVVRSWPHGIGLKVVERTPVLLIEKGGNFTEVDRVGVRFATVPQAPKGVPALELSLSRSGSASASLRRFGTDRLVREAVRVAGAVPAGVRRDTRTLKVRSYDDITLEVSGGRTVEWGSAGNGAAKARTLTALMKAASGARHFDVSVPTAPVSSAS